MLRETLIMTQVLRLTAELVPKTSWYDNMRKAVSGSDWNKIRKNVYAQYNRQCGICHAQVRLNCHEIWHYDDERHLQTLAGFIALCDWCHHIKHLGFAGMLASQGKLDYEKLIQHFMRVNECDRETFEHHRAAAMRQWKERSAHQWQVDLGDYAHLVNR